MPTSLISYFRVFKIKCKSSLYLTTSGLHLNRRKEKMRCYIWCYATLKCWGIKSLFWQIQFWDYFLRYYLSPRTFPSTKFSIKFKSNFLPIKTFIFDISYLSGWPYKSTFSLNINMKFPSAKSISYFLSKYP